MVSSPLAAPIRRGSSLVAALVAAAAGVLASGAVALLPGAAAGAQGAGGAAPTVATGYSYDFRIESGDDTPTVGRTHVLGDLSRIDLDGRNGHDGDYLLVTDGGRTLVAVDTRKREYSMIDVASFERIARTAMKAVDRVMTLDLGDLEVTGQRLGAGERIAGRATRHGRLTQDFTVTMGVFGFNEDTRHHIVTDYWVTDDLVLPRNPLFELFAALPAVLAQHDDDYTRRAAAGRDALVGRGTPLRIVITAVDEERGKGKATGRTSTPSVTTIEVTSIRTTPPDPKLFAIPQGYRKTDGFSWKGERQLGNRR